MNPREFTKPKNCFLSGDRFATDMKRGNSLCFPEGTTARFEIVPLNRSVRIETPKAVLDEPVEREPLPVGLGEILAKPEVKPVVKSVEEVKPSAQIGEELTLTLDKGADLSKISKIVDRANLRFANVCREILKDPDNSINALQAHNDKHLLDTARLDDPFETGKLRSTIINANSEYPDYTKKFAPNIRITLQPKGSEIFNFNSRGFEKPIQGVWVIRGKGNNLQLSFKLDDSQPYDPVQLNASDRLRITVEYPHMPIELKSERFRVSS